MKSMLMEMIAAEGPMPLDRYMALCLGHPQHGYYMTRDPLGAAGDFTTSPEINQIFGELIGIWCVAAWEAIGSPSPFALVELGPGRGTLMQDVLRTTSRHQAFQSAALVHLVETSPVLRKLQNEQLGARKVVWHDSIESLPQEPMIFIANEFFDALPIRRMVQHGRSFFERRVALTNGELELVLVPAPQFALGDDGLHESSPISQAIAESRWVGILGARCSRLLELSNEDRAAATMFYIGYQARLQGAGAINVAALGSLTSLAVSPCARNASGLRSIWTWRVAPP